MNNLKQIAVGLHSYADAYPGDGTPPRMSSLPAGTVFHAALSPEERLSWCVEVLPFVEQNDLYRRFDRKASWDAPVNAAGQKPLRIFWCPDWGREAGHDPTNETPYLGVTGLGKDAATLPSGHPRAGVFGHDRHTALTAIPDGTSTTLLILESAKDNGPWTRGGSATVRGLVAEEQPYLGSGRPFGGTHFAKNTLFGRGKSIGCNAAMADGSVRLLKETTAPPVLEALATVAGRDDPGADW